MKQEEIQVIGLIHIRTLEYLKQMLINILEKVQSLVHLLIAIMVINIKHMELTLVGTLMFQREQMIM